MISLKQLLEDLCINNENATRILNEETQLINYLSDDTSENFYLTFAEQVFLFEGSQTGRADCNIPPYVEYEIFFSDEEPLINQKCIRSEVVEWALQSTVSKLIFKSGILFIDGAVIITAGDFKRLNLLNEDLIIESNDKFSLDLSSREILIDLRFHDCTFSSGINISNSYCENLLFEYCLFGSSIANENVYSIYAANSVINGDFIVEKHRSKLSKIIENKDEKKTSKIIWSNIDFTFCKLNGQLKIIGVNTNPNDFLIVAGYVNFSYSQINSVVFDYASIEKSILGDSLKSFSISLYKSVLYNSLDLNYSKIESVLFLRSIICYGPLSLYGSTVPYIFADEHAFFMGTPNSISAESIEIKSIFLSEGTFIMHGAYFRNSIVTSTFNCEGSYFGDSFIPSLRGTSLSISSSIIRNAYLCNGMISCGTIYIRDTQIQNQFLLNSSRIIGKQKLKTDDKGNSSVIAINAENIKVENKISFNIDLNTNKPFDFAFDQKNSKIQLLIITQKYWEDIQQHWLNFLKKCKIYCLKSESLEIFFKEKIFVIVYKYLSKKEIKELSTFIKDLYDDKEIIKANLRTLYANNDYKNISHDIKLVIDVFNSYFLYIDSLKIANDTIKDISNHLSTIEPYQNLNKKALTFIHGEVKLEHALIIGNLDMAGSYFRNNVIIKNTHNWSNAINLRFAEIRGSFFVNNGTNQLLPFIAEGDIDIQNSTISNIFLSSSRISANGRARWQMIGAKYSYIEDDSADENKMDFYRGKWIYTNKHQSNFKQPFEQLAATLLNMGEEVHARNLLVLYTPNKNRFENFLMNTIVGSFYKAGRTISASILFFTSFFLIGALIFWYANKVQYIIWTKDASMPKFKFNSWLYSLGELIPFFKSEMKESYSNSLKDNYAILFYLYECFHQLVGLILISLVLINIARIKKGSS